MIITKEIKNLVETLHREPSNDQLTIDLISKLEMQCQSAENIEFYHTLKKPVGKLEPYPTDSLGFAVSFDPLEDEQGFMEAWEKYGIVVGKNVVKQSVRELAVNRIHEIALDISKGKWDLKNPDTYNNIPVDKKDVPFMTRGFFEMYHDNSLAQIRQSLGLYIHHVLLRGSAKLWTTFDRFGVKLPHHEESYDLPLHVDQSPLIDPHFKTIQGVLALEDCPVEKGTYVGVPGSKQFFSRYAKMAKRGDYVELDLSSSIATILKENAQPFPLRAGDIVSWDSRTTHGNTANISNNTRFVSYNAMGLANEEDFHIAATRNKAFASGQGSNVRDALMHASKPPRYSNDEILHTIRQAEELTLLGNLLYGVQSYENL